MIISSWNIRGLGSLIKKDEVHPFLIKNKLDFCCIQETKMSGFSEEEGQQVWKSEGVRWYAEDSVGRSRGILSSEGDCVETGVESDRDERQCK